MKTVFLRVLEADDKATSLLGIIHDPERAIGTQRFEIDPERFASVPRSPFAYWVGEGLRVCFEALPALQSERRVAAIGASTKDDGRFLRTYWEVSVGALGNVLLAKGGVFSPFYSDVHLLIRWLADGAEAKTFVSDYRAAHGWSPHWKAELHNPHLYFRPGLTWPRRTSSELSMRVLPAGCIFADKGPAVFVEDDNADDLLALLSITNSRVFGMLASLQLAAADAAARSYEVGLIQTTPIPKLTDSDRETLARLARRTWSLRRTLNTVNETSHAFLLPSSLRNRLGTFDVAMIEAELAALQREIDDSAYRLYGLSNEERSQIESGSHNTALVTEIEKENDPNELVDDRDDPAVDAADNLDIVSWSVGVAFGRFDLRLATGERASPAEPEPFDPLPARSSGMLPEGSPPFRRGTGVLVDDPGHLDDLTATVTLVLNAVMVETPADLRCTFARDFFPFHIQRYSKSRRKAPIYWQLSTPSASYSVWLYLHAFSPDTLYKVQNDYAGPKLRHEEQRLDGLRREYGDNPTASQRKELDIQETLVAELRTFLDEVKRVAPLWKPDLDDGVVINFAPLWRLVPHHRPWQKECMTTWEALADGQYDWSHLAMHLWPERVIPKCAKDHSLAIAHGLEEIFWAEDSDGKWKPRPTPTRPLNDIIKERTSSAVKAALDSLLSAPQPGGTSRPRGKGKRAATGGQS